MDNKGERGVGGIGLLVLEYQWHIYTTDTMYKLANNENIMYSTENST